MFHKTALRLTGLYLIIIMTISIFFSGLLYVVSSQELTRNVERQEVFINQLPPRNKLSKDFGRQLAENRIKLADSAKARILFNILLTNTLVLLAGGGVSYLLAKKSLQPIEEAHRSLERFTADASHELRTPITAMKTEIEVALMDKKLSSATAKKTLKSNLEELSTLIKLTDSLLAIARQENTRVETTTVNLHKIVEDVCHKMTPLADEKKISITISVPADLQCAVHVDSFSEALITVIDNAIKYTDTGGAVTIAAKDKDNKVELSVVDNGSGIKKSDLPYVFDRFYRSDEARSKQFVQGHGLGLSIAKKRMHDQGGDILVKSQFKKGTTVTLVAQAHLED